MDPLTKERQRSNRLLRSGCDPSIGKATQWKPGQSGNISGRPKKTLLLQMQEELANDPQYVAQMREAIIKRSLNIKTVVAQMALENLTDRSSGPITQQIEINGSVKSLSDEELEQRYADLIAGREDRASGVSRRETQAAVAAQDTNVLS